MVQAVVRESRAQRMKRIVTLAQGSRKVLQAAYSRVAGGGQPIHPGVEGVGQIHIQRLIRTKRRKNTRRAAGGPYCLVAGEIVSRIVRGAKRGHPKPLQNAMRAQVVRRQQSIGPLPYALGAVLV